MNKEYQSPPGWSLKLLKRFIRPDYLEEIQGDMEEVYQEYLEALTPQKARWRYHKEIFQLARPALVKKLSGSQKLNYYGMFQHNILLSLRIFKRYKSSFLINLIGLASGISCVLLIYLWVMDEVSIDRFHEKGDRIYRIMGNQEGASGINTWNGTSALMAEAIEANLPDVEAAIPGTDPSWQMEFELSQDETQLKAVGKYSGAEYFNVFSNPLTMGTADQALATPDAIVITEDLAVNLFGSTEKAFGQTLNWKILQFEGLAKVTGICQTPPSYSTDQFDFILPFETYIKDFTANWANPNAITYVLLKEGSNAETLAGRISQIVNDNSPNNEREFFLDAYERQYLYSDYVNGKASGGRIEYVRLFSLIAVFILLIACINFMNLSTARASRRMKEIGVKKAIGAKRASLIFQYLSESVLLAFFSMIVAIVVCNLLLPQFNLITDKQITLGLNGELVMTSIVIAMITGLLSGSYPAFFLSKFNANLVLKGFMKGSSGEFWIRRGLVFFQFTLSFVFIVAVWIFSQQIQHIQNKKLGLDKDHIVYFQREGKTTDPETYDDFLESLRNIPGVMNTSAMTNSIFGPTGGGDLTWEGMSDEKHEINKFIVYNNIVNTMGIKLLEGRDFSAEFPLKDEWQFIINESAAKLMGLDDPVGKKIKYYGIDAQIVGLVEDFHYKSLHEKIGPAYFALDPRFLVSTMVRIQAGTEKATLERIENYYKAYNPGFPFNYKFLDQDFQALYSTENKVAALSKYFAILAILISCLGLLGLVAFTAERRTKEIGIRKVLGSSKFSIVLLLSKDFTKMVIFAIVIALPISYFISRSWLDSFAYPIDLKWWFFAGAGLLSLGIAWLAVSLQTIRSASINPVTCLRGD